MSNYKRYYLKNTPVFVTLVTQHRQPWLQAHADVFLDSMRRTRQIHGFKHYAHVILPDHVHWLFEPNANANFSVIVAAVKRNCSWRLKEQGIQCGWQKRFYDHLIRDEQDKRNHLDYIHFNPVKHGFVSAHRIIRTHRCVNGLSVGFIRETGVRVSRNQFNI